MEELEAQLDAVTNGNNNKSDNNSHLTEDNKNEIFNDSENKYKNKLFRPNNSGLINHLKKENERLRKLVISYEFKNKKNNIYKTNNNDNFIISKFNFEILKKKNSLNFRENYLNSINNTYHNTNRNKDKKDMKIINKDYIYNFSNRSIGTMRKIKNISKIVKKPEIKKIKDINMFDNDCNYLKEKENRFKKYNDYKVYTNTQKERTSSLSQRKRKIINMGNTSMNSNIIKIKNANKVINNNNSNNYNINFIQQFKNIYTSRSLSKIIKRKKNDYSFNNTIKNDKKLIGVMNSYERQLNLNKNLSNQNQVMKTIENKIKDSSFFDKDFYYSSTSRQKHTQIIKRNKKNDINKEIYYQKPIINKITIYNNINNGYNNNIKQKINLNEKSGKLIFGKKQSPNRHDNTYNNFTLQI